jgi:hypothetical protein
MAPLTLSKRFDDEREIDKGDEHEIEFIEATEDAPEAFEPAKLPFDLNAASVQGLFDCPGLDAVRMRRDDRNEPELQSQLPCFVAFICAVHQQVAGQGQLVDGAQQCAPFRRIARLAGGK